MSGEQLKAVIRGINRAAKSKGKKAVYLGEKKEVEGWLRKHEHKYDSKPEEE